MWSGARWERNPASFFLLGLLFAASPLCWLFVFSGRQHWRRRTRGEIIAKLLLFFFFFIIIFQGHRLHPQSQCKVGWCHQWRKGGITIFVRDRKKKMVWWQIIAPPKVTSRVLNIDFQSWMFLNSCVLLPSINLPTACFAKRQGRPVGNNCDWKWLENWTCAAKLKRCCGKV